MRGLSSIATILFLGSPGGFSADGFEFEPWRDALEAAVKEHRDADAARQMEALIAAFDSLQPADQKSAVRDLEKCLGKRREEGDDQLYVAVVRTLAPLRELGRKATLKALRRPVVEERPEVLCECLMSLSSHKEPADVKVLTDHLVHREAAVVAAAARSLGAYETLEERRRKDLVGELVKNYSTIYANSLATPKSQRQPNQPIHRPDEERFEVVQAAFEEALQRLTPTRQTGPTAWMRWYNDHRNKRWDPED